MTAPGGDAEQPKPQIGRSCVAAVLLTFAGGAAIMATDGDFGTAEEAKRSGDPDAVLRHLPGAFVAVWIAQLVLGAGVALLESERLARFAGALAWGLFGLWLIVYLVVFRPAG